MFLCSKVSGDGPPTAVIKISLQSVPRQSMAHKMHTTLTGRIPWLKTLTKKPDIRARQAISKTPGGFLLEVIALGKLTTARCSSGPSLFAWKKDKQDRDK